MQDTQKDRDHYPDEPPPLPEYDVSPSLKKLVLLCIGTMLMNFLVAGACAIAMRILQTDVHLRTIGHLGHLPVPPVPDNVLFYALLTSHGQVMFNVLWCISYEYVLVQLLCCKQVGEKTLGQHEISVHILVDYGGSSNTFVLRCST